LFSTDTHYKAKMLYLYTKLKHDVRNGLKPQVVQIST